MIGDMATATKESRTSIKSVAHLASKEVARSLLDGRLEPAEAAEVLMDIASVEDLAELGWEKLNQTTDEKSKKEHKTYFNRSVPNGIFLPEAKSQIPPEPLTKPGSRVLPRIPEEMDY